MAIVSITYWRMSHISGCTAPFSNSRRFSLVTGTNDAKLFSCFCLLHFTNGREIECCTHGFIEEVPVTMQLQLAGRRPPSTELGRGGRGGPSLGSPRDGDDFGRCPEAAYVTHVTSWENHRVCHMPGTQGKLDRK